MKKIITISCFLLSSVGLFFILGTQTACQKQNTNCTCVITVDSMVGATVVPVNNAYVKLYAPNGTSSNAHATGYTNSDGQVNFTFALPVILNVSASWASTKTDSIRGTQIIQLQAGQTTTATITIK